MENLDICHACLSTDDICIMYDADLRDFYRQFTNYPAQESEERQLKLCFECLYNLKRTKLFRDKCVRAGGVLNQLVISGEIIQQSTLAAIRSSLQLASETWPNNSEALNPEQPKRNKKVKKIPTHIKIEPGLTQIKVEPGNTEVDEQDTQDSAQSNEEFSSDNAERNTKNEANVTAVKEECVDEDAFDDDDDDNVGEEDDDDMGSGYAQDEQENEEISLKGEPESIVVELGMPPVYEGSEDEVEDENSRASMSFQCDACPEKFDNRGNFIMHVMTHRGNPFNPNFIGEHDATDKPRKEPAVRVYTCELCPYKTPIHNDLVRHSKAHTGEKPYNCNLCPYKTLYKRDLTTHARTHTGEKPYSCEYCSYKTADKSSLTRHSRIHTGDRPYACNYCPYRTTRKSYLDAHASKHDGEKPFACEFCSYRAAHKIGLTKHARIHAGEKTFAYM